MGTVHKAGKKCLISQLEPNHELAENNQLNDVQFLALVKIKTERIKTKHH